MRIESNSEWNFHDDELSRSLSVANETDRDRTLYTRSSMEESGGSTFNVHNTNYC